MDPRIPEDLQRWREAGLVDAAQVDRILVFEQQRGPEPPRERRGCSALAVALGALMVGGGVLLFVAANWQELGPAARFLLVLALVAGFHVAGAAVAPGSPRLAPALHALGTVALGAGIFLAGQIFNLREAWPGGVLLWALGAWLGWLLLRDWPQGLLAALLTPLWLAGEWLVAVPGPGPGARSAALGIAAGALGLALTYLTARVPVLDTPLRRALGWLGGIALLPAALALTLGRVPLGPGPGGVLDQLLGRGDPAALAGWGLALVGPLVLAFLLRGRAGWMNLLAALWVAALVWAEAAGALLAGHGLCALGALGLVLWGLAEDRAERVNLGLAGFAGTVAAFYFSSVLDRLGRSLGLVVLGLLFLVGGWQLERLRRWLLARIGREAA
jgi:hypothetical protein